MIDINKINTYNFYEKYGLADVIYMFSKHLNKDIDFIINNHTESDLLKFYNDRYKYQLLSKIRIDVNSDIVNGDERKVSYGYLSHNKYLSLLNNNISINSNKGNHISCHVLSSATQVKSLYTWLDKNITNKEANSAKSIFPLITKYVNPHSPPYPKCGCLEIIGQIVATTTDNKYNYYEYDNNLGNSFICDFEDFYDYFIIIDNIYSSKNVMTKHFTTIQRGNKIDKKLTRPPIYNGNFDNNISDLTNKFKFLDMYIYLMKKSYSCLKNKKMVWYKVNYESTNIVNFNQDVLEESVKHSTDFVTFSRELLYSTNFKDKDDYWKPLYEFYRKFNYSSFKNLIKKRRTKNQNAKIRNKQITISSDNFIINKFKNKIINNMEMKKSDIENIQKLSSELLYKIYKISKDKSELVKNKQNSYVVLEKSKMDIRNSIINIMNNSSDVIDFLSNVTVRLNRYKTYIKFNQNMIDGLISSTFLYSDFKKLMNIYLFTDTYKQEINISNEDDETEEVTNIKL